MVPMPQKRKYLLTSELNYYKANMHCHSTFSDGRLTPEALKELYKSLGYSIIAFTDHNKYVYHEHLNDMDFLALAGYEADLNGAHGKCYHLNGYAKDPYNAQYIERTDENGEPLSYCLDHANEYIKKLNEGGFFVMYNHPSWSLQQPGDFLKLEGLFGFEIYNHFCEMENRTGYDGKYYNLMLRENKRIYCLATDDNHNVISEKRYNGRCGGGFIRINCDELKYAKIIQALLSGKFYSSQGPEIYDLYIEDDILYGKCSPVQSVYLMTKWRDTPVLHDNNGQITGFKFRLKDDYELFRLELFDINRKMAMSNPYYIEK